MKFKERGERNLSPLTFLQKGIYFLIFCDIIKQKTIKHEFLGGKNHDNTEGKYHS